MIGEPKSVASSDTSDKDTYIANDARLGEIKGKISGDLSEEELDVLVAERKALKSAQTENIGRAQEEANAENAERDAEKARQVAEAKVAEEATRAEVVAQHQAKEAEDAAKAAALVEKFKRGEIGASASEASEGESQQSEDLAAMKTRVEELNTQEQEMRAAFYEAPDGKYMTLRNTMIDLEGQAAVVDLKIIELDKSGVDMDPDREEKKQKEIRSLIYQAKQLREKKSQVYSEVQALIKTFDLESSDPLNAEIGKLEFAIRNKEAKKDFSDYVAELKESGKTSQYTGMSYDDIAARLNNYASRGEHRYYTNHETIAVDMDYLMHADNLQTEEKKALSEMFYNALGATGTRLNVAFDLYRKGEL